MRKRATERLQYGITADAADSRRACRSQEAALGTSRSLTICERPNCCVHGTLSQAAAKLDQARRLRAFSDSWQEAFHKPKIFRLSAADLGTSYAQPPNGVHVHRMKRQTNSAAQATSASTTAVVNALPPPPAFRACSISLTLLLLGT